ncbi:unnamed protein product [Chrysoparadoxa australica]
MLPSDLFTALPKLEILRLSNNHISYLPESMGAMKSLQVLRLDCNALTSLPDGLFTMACLEELNLSNNLLQTISPDIWRLQNLKTLQLANNSITALPQGMEELHSLSHVDLSGNPLIEGAVPESIHRLQVKGELLRSKEKRRKVHNKQINHLDSRSALMTLSPSLSSWWEGPFGPSVDLVWTRRQSLLIVQMWRGVISRSLHMQVRTTIGWRESVVCAHEVHIGRPLAILHPPPLSP